MRLDDGSAEPLAGCLVSGSRKIAAVAESARRVAGGGSEGDSV